MPANPKSNRLGWRLAIVVLLLSLTALSAALVKKLKAPHPSEVPEVRVRPMVPVGPWTEVQRQTNPTGQFDAVVVEPSQNQTELRLKALYVLPKGQVVGDEAPYRHVALYLERVADKSVFAIAGPEDLSFEWSQADRLYVKTKQASIYGQKIAVTPQLGQASTTIHLSYELEDSEFSDVFGVNWKELYGPR